MNEHQDYVLVPIEQYYKLNQIVNTREESMGTAISQEDLLFIASVVHSLGAKECELNLSPYSVHIKAVIDKDQYIDSKFDWAICKKYYNKPSAFINEVL